jgi:hypothetical protein
MSTKEASCEYLSSTSGTDMTEKYYPVAPIVKLYEKPLPSARTGALYNAFLYPAKISRDDCR